LLLLLLVIAILFRAYSVVNVSSLDNSKTIWSTHGRDETLSCRSASFNPVTWLYIESQRAPQHVIAVGRMTESEYKNKVTAFGDEASGEYELVIQNVQLNESGWYVCMVDGDSRRIVIPYFLNVRGRFIP
jgi:Immunoglobulin V-set domain